MIQTAVLSFLRSHVITKRPPDVVIGSVEDPYLRRWHLIPRNPIFNIYLHHFCRSDDDRALHDHPWWNASWLLKGEYQEEVPADPKNPAGERRVIDRWNGDIVFRGAKAAHRIMLWSKVKDADANEFEEVPVWTLFITGPRFRKWGFHTKGGWMFWQDFTENKPGNSTIGRGCD